MELLQLEFARDFFSPIFARLPPSKCRPVWHAPPVATPLSLFFVAWPGYQHNFWEKICANNILQLLKVKIIFHIKQSHNAEKQRGMGGNHRPLGSPKVKHGLPSLDLRRLHLDLVYCYRSKMVFDFVKLRFSDFFEYSISSTRGHAYKVYKYRGKSARADFFACRVVNVWNSLSDSVVFTGSSAFKRSIYTVDFSVF